MSFDIDFVIAAYPGGIRFGKVFGKAGHLLFEAPPFEIPQRKYGSFYSLLDNISQNMSKPSTTEQVSGPKITVKDYTIYSKVS